MVTRNRGDFITSAVQYLEALKPHRELIIFPIPHQALISAN